MSERICGRCGHEAAGHASVWTKATGDVPYCHGDDDVEATCYERAQRSVARDIAVPLSIGIDWPPTDPRRQRAAMSGGTGVREDTRANLLALFSAHLPEIAWSEEERVAYIACSCGRSAYVGHLTTLIVNRLHGEEEMAEWERELLERMEAKQRLTLIDGEDAP